MAASNIESEINEISSEEQPTDQDTTNRTPIGAKLVKKLETLGECFSPQNFSIFSSAANSSKSSSNEPTSNESDTSRNVAKIASM